MSDDEIVKKDPWQTLKQLTSARIALGRTGQSLPTHEILQFDLAHALAKDAIHTELDINLLETELLKNNFSVVNVCSQANSKKEYLMNPNLGRLLTFKSESLLLSQSLEANSVVVIFGDGLSATAIHNHALPLLFEFNFLLTENPQFTLAPIVLAKYARVGLSDAIGEKLKCLASIIFIGERPGLSSPDSLGIYFTWHPKIGRKESERNCISNVRQEGLSYKTAAFKTHWLLNAAAKLNASGVILKDESPLNSEYLPPHFK